MPGAGTPCHRCVGNERGCTEKERRNTDRECTFFVEGRAEEKEIPIDIELSKNIAETCNVVGLGRSARVNAGIKIRQPLSEAIIVRADPSKEALRAEMMEMIADELNVKKVRFKKNADEYAEYALKPNLPVIESKYGKKVPLIKKALADIGVCSTKSSLAEAGAVDVLLDDGSTVSLDNEDIRVEIKAKDGYAAAGDDDTVVILNIHITSALRDEGLAREIISRIQALRKEAGLPYEAHIRTFVAGGEDTQRAVKSFEEQIKKETLSEELALVSFEKPLKQVDFLHNGAGLSIGIAEMKCEEDSP